MGRTSDPSLTQGGCRCSYHERCGTSDLGRVGKLPWKRLGDVGALPKGSVKNTSVRRLAYMKVNSRVANFVVIVHVVYNTNVLIWVPSSSKSIPAIGGAARHLSKYCCNVQSNKNKNSFHLRPNWTARWKKANLGDDDVTHDRWIHDSWILQNLPKSWLWECGSGLGLSSFVVSLTTLHVW